MSTPIMPLCGGAGREKGTSLNSDSLTPKPLASSVYVRVPEARRPHKRSISVMSLFPSPRERRCAVREAVDLSVAVALRQRGRRRDRRRDACLFEDLVAGGREQRV